MMEYATDAPIYQGYSTKVSIIIPAYNEEKRIASVLKDMTEFISKNQVDWNIIIAIDGDDKTATLVSEYKKSFPYIKYKINKKRNGKGYAIKHAVLTNKDQLNDIIIIMDADNSIKFEEIASNIDKINNSDILIFNRYGKCNHIPVDRRFLGRTFNLMVRTVLGLKINDTQSGYKIFRKDALIDDLNKTGINGAFFDVSLLYHANISGQKIKEIKSKTYRHSDGSTFNTVKLTFDMFVSIFALKFRYSKIYERLPEKIIDRMLDIYQRHIKL
jgi:glycosyltransferase involved in cell wall biosynthesis